MNHICYAPGCRSVVMPERPCPLHPKRPAFHHVAGRQARGYNAEYERNRRLVMDVQQHCQGCGRPAGPGDSCDHIVPLWRGGSNEVSNLQRLCSDCHKAKTERESLEARAS